MPIGEETLNKNNFTVTERIHHQDLETVCAPQYSHTETPIFREKADHIWIAHSALPSGLTQFLQIQDILLTRQELTNTVESAMYC